MSIVDLFTGLPVQFFELDNGQSPVIDWINSLQLLDQNRIDIEVKKVAFGFKFRKGNF